MTPELANEIHWFIQFISGVVSLGILAGVMFALYKLLKIFF